MSLVKSRSRSRLRNGGAPDAMRHCIVLRRPMHQTGRGGWKAARGSGSPSYSFTESRKLDPLEHNNPQEEPMRKAGTTAFTWESELQRHGGRLDRRHGPAIRMGLLQQAGKGETAGRALDRRQRDGPELR